MKETPNDQDVVISPIRLSYYYDSDMSPEPVKDIVEFFNTYASMGDLIEIDVYLNTPGGTQPEYNVLKNLFERSSFKITLINAYEVSSYGFILFYTCRNVKKILCPHSTCTLHTISASFEDREVRKNDSHIRNRHNILDKCNEDFLLLIKSNKIVSTTDYNKIVKGEDVTILYDQLHKVMLRCSFGIYIPN